MSEVVALETVASRASVIEASYADGEVKITYMLGGKNEMKMKFHDAPTPDFCAALAHLRRHAVRIMDLHDEKLGEWTRTVAITGLSLKSIKGERHARFILRKRLTTGLLLDLKTPYMRVRSASESEIQIGEGADEDIDRMLAEAQKYIAGERAQKKLFDEEAA